MIKLHSRLVSVFAVSALALLAACNNEAGQNIDEGGFGTPTMINLQAMTGQATVAMQHRFAAEVPTTINFEFDKWDITPEAQAILLKQAAWIQRFPEVKFRVYGHTDKVGSDAYNKSLGLRRAQAVVNFFASQGISRARLEAMVSFGETQPLILTEQPELRNRRTVTEVQGFVAGTPGLLDGNYAEIIYREYVGSAARAIAPTTATNSAVAPSGAN